MKKYYINYFNVKWENLKEKFFYTIKIKLKNYKKFWMNIFLILINNYSNISKIYIEKL